MHASAYLYLGTPPHNVCDDVGNVEKGGAGNCSLSPLLQEPPSSYGDLFFFSNR